MLAVAYYMAIQDFYPRSPCGERRGQDGVDNAVIHISIHALLAESDLAGLKLVKANTSISIHALLAESDLILLMERLKEHLFLSTLSLRRATDYNKSMLLHLHIFLSTLSLRRATAKVHKTVGHFCAYETNFVEIASSC